jgi:CRISPR-associated exonuclease Cas4
MASRRRTFDWSGLRSGGAAAPSNGIAGASHPRATDTPREGRAAAIRAAGPVVPAGEVDTQDGDALTPALRVNDVKQYAYCPRIVFYQYTMPVQRKATFKMEHGKAAEGVIEALEQRRTLREYGLAEGIRRFHQWLTSPRLGLSGRLDLLITTPRGAVPVDFKDTTQRVQHNHHVQLCAYALLVEDVLAQRVEMGCIYRIPRREVTAIPITAELRAQTVQMLAAIRRMIRTESMPDPTPVRARCAECEYRNYCGDIF